MPLELREVKMDEFLSLKQGNLSVKECFLWFTQFSKYAPEVVSTQAKWIYRFVNGFAGPLKDLLSVAAMNRDLDIARIMARAQQIEEDQRNHEGDNEKEKSKRARTASQYQGCSGASTSRGPLRQTQSAVRSTSNTPTQFLRHTSEWSQTSREPDLRPQRGVSRRLPPHPTCRQCGRPHGGECRRGSNTSY
ncbi:uncharacterized protein LOC124886360 [Capsicum annuum]|uniref:uncharacterized protein LOC124886360 n=1 Tax=Capsicum annuum TaxID=4072 RepID=UPI001FB185B3|nr:uncharacterized protein LOC124886360 [Capsicum annuum]